jgi:hypothetical protein
VSGPDKIYFGGADGIRTHDLLDAIEARSQLRHGPTEKKATTFPVLPGRAPNCAIGSTEKLLK